MSASAFAVCCGCGATFAIDELVDDACGLCHDEMAERWAHDQRIERLIDDDVQDRAEARR